MTNSFNFNMYRKELLQSLQNLDADLLAAYGFVARFEMTIVGSGALIILGTLSPERATTDVDVLEASQEIAPFLRRYNMNPDVSTFLYTFPENWRKRRQKLTFEGDCLEVYTMSLEDLLISKLIAYREADKADLKDILYNELLSWDVLDKLINNPVELQAGFASDAEWQKFLQRYEKLKTSRKVQQ